MLDIDHFKQVNDEWGHLVGDRVLTHLADVLTGQSREIDVVARLGGEEFAVLMPGSDQAGATALTERVRAALASGDSHQPGLPPVRVSAGVLAPEPLEVQTMLEQADRVLYAAKLGGRNRTVVVGARELAVAA